MPLTYFAEISPKPEYFDDALRAVADIVDQTCAEPGCLKFDVFECNDRKKLFIMEVWQDQAAFNAHHAQPYTKAVFISYQSWLNSMPILTELNKVA